jgi:hypothetical protein
MATGDGHAEDPPQARRRDPSSLARDGLTGPYERIEGDIMQLVLIGRERADAAASIHLRRSGR